MRRRVRNRNRTRGKCVLVSNGTLTTYMTLLLVMTLLRMMLLMRLMLVLLCHVHLHVPLVAGTPVHHHMLALLVRLIKHAVSVMVGGLRDWRAGRRGSIVTIPSSCIVDRRSVARKMAMVMILLVMLWVIILARSGLLEPVRTICHRMNKVELAWRKTRSPLLERMYLMGLSVALGM